MNLKNGGGGGYTTKFYTGRLRPAVQPLTLSYIISTEWYPFRIPFIEKGSLITFLLKNTASLKQEVVFHDYFHFRVVAIIGNGDCNDANLIASENRRCWIRARRFDTLVSSPYYIQAIFRARVHNFREVLIKSLNLIS